MNGADNAAELQGSEQKKEKGFVALATVQFVGMLLAINLTFFTKNAYSREIPDGWHFAMLVVVWVVLGLTFFVTACQKDVAPSLWEDIGGNLPGPSFLCWFDLASAHRIYFLADFAALAFLIYATGGPQQSLYTTFLLVIVPISIALGKPNIKTVVTFASITLVIFLTLLCLDPVSHFKAVANTKFAPKGWLAVVTIACVIFPTLVFCIQNWELRDSGEGVTTQQTEETTTLAPSEYIEEIATPGDHDRDLEAGIIQ